MARLNEPVAPAAPVESVEALKRRFLRQNREIARANSTQSLRIRTLEAETSRLLSENLVLREKVISLEHELDHRPKREVLEDLDLVKDKLEAKLAELGGLVFELGRAQRSAIATSAPSRRQSRGKSPKRSPDQRIWKNALTLSEVTGGQDGRLPSIVEDKYYPRRTLDSEELFGILNDQGDSADSPDLGPPPVAHFDDGDTVKQDGGHQVSLESNPSDLGSSLAFTNLETRRKRRESTFSKEPAADLTSILTTSLENTSTPIGTLSSQPLKLGAKRKLSVRDDEERIDPSVAPIKDDFRFNRRTEASNEPMRNVGSNEGAGGCSAMSRKTPQEFSGTRGDTREKAREVSLKPTTGRKALGEKSVNTDPVHSPRKPSKATVEGTIMDIKKDISRKPHDRGNSRVKSSAPRPVRSIQDTESKTTTVPIIEEVSPPKTDIIVLSTLAPMLPPATPIHPDLNLLSPVSSQPTTSRLDSRDTPPPGDIQSDASSASSISVTGRTTRRPRSSVSYAEPNLRDKMRRPGKELVDAVGADERIQRAASVKAEDMPIGQSSVDADGDIYISHVQQRVEPAKIFAVMIKKEEGTEDHEEYRTRYRQKALETRAEPQSPLSGKTAAVEALPTSVLMDRRKYGSEVQHSKGREQTEIASAVTKTVPSTIPSSGSSSAIAALVAGTRTKQSNNLREDIERRSKNRDQPVKSTASAAPDLYDFQGSSLIEAKDSSAHARSSSSSSIAETKSADVSERVRVARRSSSVADFNGAAPCIKTATGSIRGRRRRETLSNAAENESDTVKASAEGGGKSEVGTRAERAVARRRSMLV
ncbi:hypothetical protein MMC17_006157 [Xylographa soralifera]|nr:hypothetical protein [Xylographa soralifera]